MPESKSGALPLGYIPLFAYCILTYFIFHVKHFGNFVLFIGRKFSLNLVLYDKIVEKSIFPCYNYYVDLILSIPFFYING